MIHPDDNIEIGETWYYRECRKCGDIFCGNSRKCRCLGCGSDETRPMGQRGYDNHLKTKSEKPLDNPGPTPQNPGMT